MERDSQFDQAYYDRFYYSKETRVTSAEQHAPLARFVFAFAEHSGLDVKRVLDVGAGIGLWKRWIERHKKDVSYTGTEVSSAMCEKYGFEQRDIARFRSREQYDLIICQGVLQYLPDPDVAPAVANLAAMSCGLLYLEITTRLDLKERCDLELTDSNIHVRNGSYYRGLLNKHFYQVGAGLWWPRELPPPFFELEMSPLSK